MTWVRRDAVGRPVLERPGQGASASPSPIVCAKGITVIPPDLPAGELAALPLGLHPKPLNGQRVTSRASRQAFRLLDDTHLVAFATIGRAIGDLKGRSRRSVEAVLLT